MLTPVSAKVKICWKTPNSSHLNPFIYPQETHLRNSTRINTHHKIPQQQQPLEVVQFFNPPAAAPFPRTSCCSCARACVGSASTIWRTRCWSCCGRAWKRRSCGWRTTRTAAAGAGGLGGATNRGYPKSWMVYEGNIPLKYGWWFGGSLVLGDAYPYFRKPPNDAWSIFRSRLNEIESNSNNVEPSAWSYSVVAPPYCSVCSKNIEDTGRWQISLFLLWSLHITMFSILFFAYHTYHILSFNHHIQP